MRTQKTSNLTLAALAAGFFALASPAIAVTIVFDDFSLSGNDTAPIPNDYQSLNWNNFSVLNGGTHVSGNSGYAAGVVSTSNVAYNGFGNPASISSSEPFTLTSAYLTAAWNDGLTVRVQGYFDGNLLYTTDVFPSATEPTLYTFNFEDVDAVVFASFGGTQHPGYPYSGTHFALDNLEVMTSEIPEPSSALALGALLGAGLVTRARRR